MSSEQETVMLWKEEPLSPSGTFDIDEEWLLLDEKPALLENGIEDAILYGEQLTRAQVASRYLEELEHKTWIKEESFADWLEEKIDLPIFEELPAPECGQNRAVVYPTSAAASCIGSLKHPQPVHQHQQQVLVGVGPDTTQSLLQEFETVLGDVEACHQVVTAVSTLTPPQSPPPLGKRFAALPVSATANAHLFVSLQPIQQSQAFVYEQQHQQHLEDSARLTSLHGQQQQEAYAVTSLPIEQQQQQQQQQPQQQTAEQWNPEQLSLVPLVHPSDMASELAKVDEYVRSCAEDVPANPNASSNASSASSSAPPSPYDSSNNSCMSSEDSADDPDWSYESTVASTSSNSSGSRKITSGGARGRRSSSSKPYSRGNNEDKRSRKKEQNKNAATRYRQKKKQEIKEILGEEQELAARNDKLQAQVKDLQREIGYLKGLMRDLFKAKGLVK